MEHEQEAAAGDDRQAIRRTDANQLSDGPQLARSPTGARCGEEAFAGRGVLGDTGSGSKDGAAEAGAEAGREEKSNRTAMKDLQLLPSCPLSVRCFLPAVSAVYFLM